MEMISKTNDKFKQMKEMIKTNHFPNITITDDLQVLELALKYKLEIELLLVTDKEYKDETKELINKLIAVSNEAYMISESSYDLIKLKDNHAGVIAAIKLKKYSVDDFKHMEFITVLDHLEIPGNVGTIYRTLDSVNIDGVILVDEITKINNKLITSSSRGCNLIIPTISLSYAEAQKLLLEANFDIFLGEPELGLDYKAYDYKNKTAIVVGNERFGINKGWYENKNKKVFIPMSGNQNSLNVGVAASILVYEAYMKRK